MLDAKFIKTGLYTPVLSDDENPSPLFRKKFSVNKKVSSAKVSFAGLGIGHFYLNGERISADLFTAPVSDYTKTVWYNSYDVSDKINLGENIIAAVLGNGFYNETINSAWYFDKAPWRDGPKLAFSLSLIYEDGTKEEIKSDESWVCTEKGPYIFNALRSGVIYDARLYAKGWNTLDFDDSAWDKAVIDDNPPTGIFRECLCEPIREFESFYPEKISQVGDKFVVKFPRNISGYVRIRTKDIPRGTKITIRYAESVGEDGNIFLHGCDAKHMYPTCRYAFCDFTADGEDFVWTPKFVYYGFRYIEVVGLENTPTEDMFEAVFVHQALEVKAQFSCSDERLNRLYRMGIAASQSNMFYGPTDCPTREKLGWANDTQSSTEQFLINFASVDFLKKWYRDVLDAQCENGEIPGIVPSSGWGIEWGTGPISNGVLYEIPLRIYHYTGDSSLLRENTGAFRRLLSHMASKTNEKGLVDYGLCDWAGPWEGPECSPVPRECTETLLYIKFLRITRLAAELNGEETESLLKEEQRITELFKNVFFNEKGEILYPYQASLSMCLMLDVYVDFDVTANELVKAVQKDNYHINCGMLGIRYLYYALRKIGRDDLAYRIVTAEDNPSYFSWITERDATTFCEMFDKDKDQSQNHHMFSDVLAWMMKVLAGITPTAAGFSECVIKPYLDAPLSFVKAQEKTVKGIFAVEWKKENGETEISVSVPENTKASLDVFNQIYPLSGGENTFKFKV